MSPEPDPFADCDCPGCTTRRKLEAVGYRYITEDEAREEKP